MKPDMIDAAGARGVEMNYFILWALLFAWVIFDTWRKGRLSDVALCAVAAQTIWWQDFYADWGAYMLYSSEFRLIPWGSTFWTTPNKPWFVVFAYPVFMTISITLMLALCRSTMKLFKSGDQRLVCFLTASLALIAINTGLEVFAVSGSGQWTYDQVIGPAIETVHGNQPLLVPNIPFGIWGGVICALIYFREDAGTPRFEAIIKASSSTAPLTREADRALAWIIIWNVTYWLFLCTPLIMIREVFGGPSVIVP